MKIGFNTNLAADKGLLFIGGGALVLLMLAVATFVYVGTQADYDKEYISLAGEQRVLSQSLVKNAVESSSAKVEAFKQLKQARISFENIQLNGINNAYF